MVNKRGAEKYYIIISLILGLMVLGLSLFFIFNEYFTEGELNWQQCRQSIILRTNLPEADLIALKYDLKGAFPLKCKTEVVTINSADPEKVYSQISEAVAEGWYMFGEGKFDFIHRDNLKSTKCLVFGRVHFTEEAIQEFNENNLDADSLEEFRKKYNLAEGADVEKYVSVDFTRNFVNYYRLEKVPGTSSSYSEYLPLHHSNSEVLGRLIIMKNDIYPSSDDLLLVYSMLKFDQVEEVGRKILKGLNAVSGIFGFDAWGEELAAANELEAERNVYLISADRLKDINCDKFLTIPA